MDDNHKQKFAQFLLMCNTMKEQKADVLVVDHPEVLGDTYEELITNLAYLAEKKLMVQIVPMKQRMVRR